MNAGTIIHKSDLRHPNLCLAFTRSHPVNCWMVSLPFQSVWTYLPHPDRRHYFPLISIPGIAKVKYRTQCIGKCLPLVKMYLDGFVRRTKPLNQILISFSAANQFSLCPTGLSDHSLH